MFVLPDLGFAEGGGLSGEYSCRCVEYCVCSQLPRVQVEQVGTARLIKVLVHLIYERPTTLPYAFLIESSLLPAFQDAGNR